MRTNIFKVALFFLLCFLVLIVYLTYIVEYQGDMLATHPKNRRVWLIEEQTVRGGIFDRNGETLAKTDTNGANKRIYPLGASSSHFLGYSSPKYGKTGLEDAYDHYLLGMTGRQKYINYFRRLVGKPAQGYDLYLTIDSELQKEAYNLLKGRRGAVVALQPQTGAILALASSPGFDPNGLHQIWEDISKAETSPLLNRATQGIYPPGSVIKVAVAAGALEQNPALWNKTFNSPGYIEIEGRTIRDSVKTNSKLKLEEALAFSSNVVFVELALEMGAENFYNLFHDFYFNKAIPFDLPVKKSQLPTARKLEPNALAESAIGQGQMLVTPFHLALITATIANGGIMMEPYIVDKLVTPGGTVIKKHEIKELARPIGAEAAQLVGQGMKAVVDWGTGQRAAIPGVQVAGKTGSAQNPQGISHAWFIGFAPVEDPQIAVAIVLENEGAGGRQAAPIAQKLFTMMLGRKR